MDHPEWRPAFHIAPRHGWMNDPNGLCHYRGRYHAFYQYTPDWPGSDLRSWGHATSTDLIVWTDEGEALSPDTPEDRTGAWSGCAVIADGGRRMDLYYTGNVILGDGFDPVHGGREANQILVTSEDGRSFSEKRVLLRPGDYPPDCTRHVRDPKVWEEDGRLWMVLGARSRDGCGEALVYRSDDGIAWEHHRTIRSREPLGYMWECPNIAMLEGKRYLAICPQGLESEKLRRHNRWQAGYLPLDAPIPDTALVEGGSFTEWDFGWDFYAPQIFSAADGRSLMIGWMGTFDEDRSSTPDGLPWCHCLTLPRELSRAADNRILQAPVRELGALRGTPVDLDGGIRLPDHLADIVIDGIEGAGALVLDGALSIGLSDGLLTISFSDSGVGAGRTRRSVGLPRATRMLRVIVDRSTVEIYLNGGETVFSTRWFPQAAQLSVSSGIGCASAQAWPLAGRESDRI